MKSEVRRYSPYPVGGASFGFTGRPLLNLDVEDASRFELITNDGGDGISGDHGNWADAQLRR